MDKTTLNNFPDQALSEITAIFSQIEYVPTVTSDADCLFSTCQILATALNLKLHKPPLLEKGNVDVALEAITQHSHCQIRSVILSDSWWSSDSGPMLVFRQSDQSPCALLPSPSGGYRLIDPVSRKSSKVTESLAATLLPSAYSFYALFPDKPLDWRALCHFILTGRGRDIRRLIVLQILIASLGLLIPIATGMLFDQVVPNADYHQLTQFVVVLTVNTVAISFFMIAQIFMVMRLKFKINVTAQSALWDRLLRLPIPFFRNYTAGDLADRAGGFDQIQQTMTGAIIQTLMGGGVSLLTLALMFYYDLVLASSAMLLVFIIVCINLIVDFIQLKHRRKLHHLDGQWHGFTLQLLTAISKLRLANRESQAFIQWLKITVRKTKIFMKIENLLIKFNVFQAIAAVLITALLFALVISRGTSLSFGNFIAFNATFAQFILSVFLMLKALTTIFDGVPLLERLEPIILQSPEVEHEGVRADQLIGHVTLKHVFFRYEQDGAWILNDVSLDIAPGQFIAIVGGSGEGKSTLLRLLLGFETPVSGSVLYDQQDLAILNRRSVRRQMGVVLQNSQLMPGTILDNIMGGMYLSEDVAWQIARRVVLDRDIDAMPMKMQTMLSEFGKTLSMGQRQRLMLARALVHQPKILLLDEATSAIDNHTQSTIFANLRQLGMVRIVVAQRLSTVMQADCIYVLDQGEVAESGSYQWLMNQKGRFYRLARRQLTG